MRIEGSYRPAASARSGARGGSTSTFQVGAESAARQTGAALQTQSSPTIDSLLALQAVEDPLLKKKKALRRGSALLDALDALKTDLLGGRVGEGRLLEMLRLIGQARERADPRTDGLLDDIELRARVELAKFGHYPAL